MTPTQPNETSATEETDTDNDKNAAIVGVKGEIIPAKLNYKMPELNNSQDIATKLSLETVFENSNQNKNKNKDYVQGMDGKIIPTTLNLRTPTSNNN